MKLATTCGLAVHGVPRSPRRRAVLRGTFQTLHGRFDIVLRNVSCTGALIERPPQLRGTIELHPNTEGVLEANGLDVLCKVVRCDGTFFGVEFDEPLEMDTVLSIHRITGLDIKRSDVETAKTWFDTQAR